MTAAAIDMDEVRRVLLGAIKPAGTFTRRGLARAAGLDRDAVYDILQGRNRNPSIRVLAALAAAMEADVSVFGVAPRSEMPSEAELEQAILEALPDMPRRGSFERKASFLAAAVAGALGLPQDRQASLHAPAILPGPGTSAASPPPDPTIRA
jgi:transcriptional regulator with XRE-family HTH domain